MTDRLIYTIFLLGFMAIMFSNGLILKKKVTSAKSFITGNQNIGVLLGAGMFIATFLSSSSITGQVGYVHGVGWAAYSSILGTVISIFIVGYLMVDKLREQADYGCETIPDIFYARYGSNALRGLMSISIVILYTVFVAVELMGLAKTIAYFLDISYTVAIIISMLFTLSYIYMGGLLAVAYNDSISAIIGVGGTIIVAFIALAKVGGFTAMNIQLAEVKPDMIYTINSSGGIPLIISLAAVWGIGNSSHPAYLGQALGAKSRKSILRSLLISAIFIAIFYFMTQILGIVSQVLNPNLVDVDASFPVLVKELTNPVFAGVLVAAVLALVMSTTDTVLLTAGAALGSDFLSKTLGKNYSDEKRLALSRMSVIGIGIIGTIIALLNPSQILIFQMLNYGAAGSVFFVPIIFGLYWKRANKEGAISSMIGGFGAYILWFLLKQPFGLHPILFGVAVAVVLMITVSLLTPQTSDEILNHFFKRKLKV